MLAEVETFEPLKYRRRPKRRTRHTRTVREIEHQGAPTCPHPATLTGPQQPPTP